MVHPHPGTAAPISGRLRKLGWLTMLAFIAKGLVSTALILWALLSAVD